MGTGAVYVTLSGLKGHPGLLTNVETVFFFINLSLFILNSSTLLLQALCAILVLPVPFPVSLWNIVVYPQQSKRLLNDPVKGVFVPLIVRIITRSNVLRVLTPYNRSCHLPLS